MTTVSDLIRELEQYDPDVEVRLAIQPNYPFEYSISSYNCPVAEVMDDNGNYTLYIVQGEQLGYLSQEATEACGW